MVVSYGGISMSEQLKPILVTTKDAARLLGLSPQTLRNWRNAGKGPRFVHVSTGKSPALYPYDELVRWAESLGERHE
jgi:predicted site-specific integrase-resolvase